MLTGWRGQYLRYKDLFLNIMSLYKKRRDVQAFLEVILSLTTVIILVIFALKPTILTILSLYNQIKSKRETLNSLNLKIGALQKANNFYNQNQQFLPIVNAAIFNNPEPDTISKQVLGLAAKNTITIMGISIGQATIFGKELVAKNSTDLKSLPENAQSMPISISFRGSYPNLILFIKDLENLRIPIKFDSLAINASQNQEGSIIVGIVTARVPFLGQK